MKHSMRLNAVMYCVCNLEEATDFWVERFGYRVKAKLLDKIVTLTAKEVDSAPDRFGEIWTDYDNKEQCMWHVDYHAPPKIILVLDTRKTKGDSNHLHRISYTTPFFDDVKKEWEDYPMLEYGRHFIVAHPVLGVEVEIMEKLEHVN